ncbi:GGDEF domain-containing protein [Pararhizobium sp. BT-229]|uniref:GGDEF domain-containing protein n=1 Tax=Pararhizobium sp. BT-229 TaxID=2986923 RepID=UPI0021F7F9BC|nr:GGDEF domain-containing protein [Pararhizobium sp. BT-229]MCV9960507.1 GGDEF domain-containing protein [Pararhizobium sp. BT-229]
MNGALFLLTVNFLIAQLFCVFFLIISKRSRIPSAARWFAAAFAVASLSAVFEVIIRYADFDRFASFGAFSSLLFALFMIRAGIGRLYAVPSNVPVITAILAASLALNLMIYDLPRSTVSHSLGYQFPFFVAELISAAAVYRSGRREKADLILMALLLLTAAHFASKVYLAVTFGAGSNAQAYLASTYALVSQSLGAVLVVSTGLTLLAVIVVEIMDDAKANSEIDPLSGLFNRRGFNERVDQILSRPISTYPHCVILCDLDHFKAVNDTYGHTAGDQVILSLGRMLKQCAPPEAICARFGGEEFAIFLPSTSETTGYLFAQGLRGSFSSLAFPGLPEDVRVTASFGVCGIESTAISIADAINRADAALYDAKRNGRNRVTRTRQATMINLDDWQAKA